MMICSGFVFRAVSSGGLRKAVNRLRPSIVFDRHHGSSSSIYQDRNDGGGDGGFRRRRIDRTGLSDRLGSSLTVPSPAAAILDWRPLPEMPQTGRRMTMSQEEADLFRKENRIAVKWERGGAASNDDGDGDAILNPVLDFEDTGFPDSVVRKLRAAGFQRPTPVQAQGWPVASAGLDLIAIGETGSGKTLGYLLPAVARLLASREAARGLAPAVLVLAPTRELAQQIEGVLAEYSRGLNLRSVCLFGGASRNPQIQKLERGVDVIIATPGRLIDLADCGAADLGGCSYVVLDEADRMLDMGFEPQVRAILSRVRRQDQRQLLMWSATWPREVRQLAEDMFQGEDQDEEDLSSGVISSGQGNRRQRGHVHLTIGSPSEELQANRNISQKVYIMEQGSQKMQKLLELLRLVRKECEEAGRQKPDKVLIFAQTKKTVDFVERMLRREEAGWQVSSIHGDKTQRQRDDVMERFRSNRVPVLVATDVASRGLDVSDVCHVINFDHPPCAEDYVHRIGRTGRAGSKAACSVSHTFLTRQQDMRAAGDLITVLEKAGQPVPEELRDLHSQTYNKQQRGGGRSSSSFFNDDAAGFSRYRHRHDQYQQQQGFRQVRYNRSFVQSSNNRQGDRISRSRDFDD